MLISVIIPVYNGEKFVEKAIISAASQKEVLEVLVVDDGSTDNTIQVCKALEKRNMKVELFNLNSNKGPAAARNIGMKSAKGKYITFLDADDYYLDARFSRAIQILENKNSVDGVYSCVKNLGAENYDSIKGQPNIIRINSIVASQDLFKYMVKDTNDIFSIISVVFRNELLKKVGYFDENFHFSEDLDFLYRLALHCKLIDDGVIEPLIVRVVHGKNMTLSNEYIPDTSRFQLVDKWFSMMIKDGFGRRANFYILRRQLHMKAYLFNNALSPFFRIIFKIYSFIEIVIKQPILLMRLFYK